MSDTPRRAQPPELKATEDTRQPLTGPRYYDASKNPEEAMLPGVPLRDLAADEFEALPLWLQYSVDAAPMYRRSKPRTAPEEA